MRFLADENFNDKLLDKLQNLLPELDILRAQDTDFTGASDPDLIEWAATQNRILLTHDVNTLAGYAYDRVRQGLPMVGIIEVNLKLGIGATVDELVLLIEASSPEEFEDQVRFIPLR